MRSFYMRCPTLVWSLLIISLLLPSGANLAFSQTSRRNFAEYKQGPSFNLRHYYAPAGNEERAPLRQFLWELWKTRTKGFFNVISYTREGDPAQCRLFVEPDSKGQWTVVSECKYTVCPYSSESRCRDYLKKVFTTRYHVVKRLIYGDLIYSSSGPKRQQREIPDSEDRSALDFVLVLEDSVSGARSEW
jgi:hypothetical protein